MTSLWHRNLTASKSQWPCWKICQDHSANAPPMETPAPTAPNESLGKEATASLLGRWSSLSPSVYYRLQSFGGSYLPFITGSAAHLVPPSNLRLPSCFHWKTWLDREGVPIRGSKVDATRICGLFRVSQGPNEAIVDLLDHVNSYPSWN